MRLTVTATEGHQGEALEVDLDREIITLLDTEGQSKGTVTWGAVIRIIKSMTQEENFAETRGRPRIPLALKVRCTTTDGQQFESLTGGLGSGGLFIENSAPLPPGTDLTVEFALPDRPMEPMIAKAKVAWVCPKSDQYTFSAGMGVQFTNISAEARGRVQDLVRSQLRSG